jgi:hypothetical protein
MGEEPRPRASVAQLVGVWLTAAGLLLSVARVAVEVWPWTGG